MGSAGATAPGSNGKIAYTGFVDDFSYEGETVRTHIYTVNPDGTGLKDLTPNILFGRTPVALAWSPDGTKLAYALIEKRDPMRVSLNLMNPDGSGRHRIRMFAARGDGWYSTYDNVTGLAWSRDGSEIAFVVRGTRSNQVAAVRPDGTGYRLLTHFAHASILDFDWSADGGQLAVLADLAGADVYEAPVWLVPVGGGSLALLDATPTRSLDLSPDGSVLAAMQDWRHVTIRMDGGGTVADPGTNEVAGVVWSPDATRFAVEWSRSCCHGPYVGVTKLDGSCVGAVGGIATSIAWQPGPPGPPPPPVSCADVGLGLSRDRSHVQLGKTYTLIARAISRGTDPAQTAVVTVKPGQASNAISATTSQGSCTVGRPVRCQLGTVAVGDEVTVSVKVRVIRRPRGSYHPGWLADSPTAEFSSPGDLNPYNDFAWNGNTEIVVCDILGTEGRDTLIGTPRNDLICGLGRSDTIRGRGGNDVLKGGAGNDRVFGDAGADVVLGGSGNDRLVGGSGHDTIHGGKGWDFAAPSGERLYGIERP